MKCAVCSAEIEEDADTCLSCGAEAVGPVQAVKERITKMFSAIDMRLRIGIAVFVVLLVALAAYRMTPGEGSIAGTIVWQDPAGSFPVVGARILVVRNNSVIEEKHADDEGKFSITAPVGEVELIAADLGSVKTGKNTDYTITDRKWLARFWKESVKVRSGQSVSIKLTNNNVSAPEIEYFSKAQLTDYQNRAGWMQKGPFTETQVRELLESK